MSEQKLETTEQEATDKQASNQADKQTSDERDSDRQSEDDKPNPAIKPVKEKIGEGRDNLRQREEWYQRRTGGSS